MMIETENTFPNCVPLPSMLDVFRTVVSNNFKLFAWVNYVFRNKLYICNLEQGKKLLLEVKLVSPNEFLFFKFSKNNQYLFFSQYRDNSFNYVDFNEDNISVKKIILDIHLINVCMSKDEKYIFSISEYFQHSFKVTKVDSQFNVIDGCIISANFRTFRVNLLKDDKIIFISSRDLQFLWMFSAFNRDNKKNIKIWTMNNKWDENLKIQIFNSFIILTGRHLMLHKKIIFNFQTHKMINKQEQSEILQFLKNYNIV